MDNIIYLQMLAVLIFLILLIVCFSIILVILVKEKEKEKIESWNICVISGGTKGRKYTYYAKKSHQMWCKKHNYVYIYEDLSSQNYIHWKRNFNLIKPYILKKYIKSYDYIIWLDDDVFVNAMNEKIGNIINASHGKNIIVARDMGPTSNINNGIIILKNTTWTRTFLDEWWKRILSDNDIRSDQKIMDEMMCEVEQFRKPVRKKKETLELFSNHKYSQLLNGRSLKDRILLKNFCILSPKYFNARDAHRFKHLAGRNFKTREKIFAKMWQKYI